MLTSPDSLLQKGVGQNQAMPGSGTQTEGKREQKIMSKGV